MKKTRAVPLVVFEKKSALDNGMISNEETNRRSRLFYHGILFTTLLTNANPPVFELVQFFFVNNRCFYNQYKFNRPLLTSPIILTLQSTDALRGPTGVLLLLNMSCLFFTEKTEDTEKGMIPFYLT